MGANSIDISQYRSRIGTFSGKLLVCHNGRSSASFGNGLKTKNLLGTFIMLSHLLIISGVIQTILIMSGVEMNPGPFSIEKETTANHQLVTASDNVTRKQDVSYGTSMATTSNCSPSTPKIQQPKIDATDRRQIEAQNEDKSRTTKEELDDIECTHYKEKKKKEQSNMEPGPSGINTQGWANNNTSMKSGGSYAWDPKYAMSTKNTKKDTTKYGTASTSLLVTVSRSEGKHKKIKSIDPAKLSVLEPPSGNNYQSIIKTRSQHDNPISNSLQNRMSPAIKGKKRNQEQIINQAAYDHGKTNLDRLSGLRNKGKYQVHHNAKMALNDISTLEVKKDIISTLPTEMALEIMKNLSESNDIVSYALACENAMVMIPDLHQEIVISDENVVKRFLRCEEGRRVVSKLIYGINTKVSGDEKISIYTPPAHKFFNYRHGVTIETHSDCNTKMRTMMNTFNTMVNKGAPRASTFEQPGLLQEILDTCPHLSEIMMIENSMEDLRNCSMELLDFSNFQVLGLPNRGNISENDIRILSSKLPNLKNLTLIRNRKGGYYHSKVQIIAPKGLVNGWSVTIYLSEGNVFRPCSTTDEKFERLIVNWKSITKIRILSSFLTDRSIKLLSETNTALQIITLFMKNLTGKSLDCLGLYCKNLYSISININKNITESSIRTLLHLKKIRTLRLNEIPDVLPSGISEEGLTRIFPMIENIQNLYLQSDHLVTDYVMESLANHCQNLHRLTLWGEDLTGTGLLRALRATGSSLKYLNLEGSPIDKKDLMKIPKLCVLLEEIVLGDLGYNCSCTQNCLNYLKSRIKTVKLLYEIEYSAPANVNESNAHSDQVDEESEVDVGSQEE